MIITRTINEQPQNIKLSVNELAYAYKEYLIQKMKTEVLLWDLEFTEEDAQTIAERAYERLERISTQSRRECLNIEVDRFRKEQQTKKVGVMMYL